MREEPTQASRSDAAPFSPWRGPELRKMAALVASIVLLLLSGYLSWRQPSPGQLDLPAVFPHLKWFRYPIEVNPENRPPTYPSNWFWYPLAVNPQNRPPTDHIFLDSIAVIPGSSGKSLAVVGTYGTILHTTDGGASWSLQKNGTEGLWSVTFPNAQTGWAVGPNGTILHTTDGGASWNLQNS